MEAQCTPIAKKNVIIDMYHSIACVCVCIINVYIKYTSEFHAINNSDNVVF